MLYQLSYCPRKGDASVPATPVGHPLRLGSAGLLVDRVFTVVAAVLAHLEAFTIIDLGLHRDVVASFALGALEGDLHPLVALGHLILSSSVSTAECTQAGEPARVPHVPGKNIWGQSVT
jgi:hypothetical protein